MSPFPVHYEQFASSECVKQYINGSKCNLYTVVHTIALTYQLSPSILYFLLSNNNFTQLRRFDIVKMTHRAIRICVYTFLSHCTCT